LDHPSATVATVAAVGRPHLDVVAQKRLLDRRLLLEIHEAVGGDQRGEGLAPRAGCGERRVVDARVSLADPKPLGERRIHPGRHPETDLADLLARHSAHGLARPIARRDRLSTAFR